MFPQKHRPIRFEDMVGQEIPRKVLTSMLKRYAASGNNPDTLPNALILCGSYGSGKTTSARILARYLNCDQGPLTACGECNFCKQIDKDNFRDLIEIDAASNRGISDIRQLQADLAYAISGNYRIVILDEAHSLSKEAWEALLKTLEESHKNQLFVFATTDAHKIPDTIKSRSFTLTVTTVSYEQAAHRLNQVAEIEELQVAEGVAEAIAHISHGHMRDCLQLLETASTIVEDGQPITLDDVYVVAGMQSHSQVQELLRAFFENDHAGLLPFSKEGNSMAMLRAAVTAVDAQIQDISTASDNVPLYDKLLLLELLQQAIIEFSKHDLYSSYIYHYFNQFQEKRVKQGA